MRNKKYTIHAKNCIKGEAFFELIISDYAIPNKMFLPKDLGNDFICEWVYKDNPTGLLFISQIKTITITESKIKEGSICQYNKLKEFKISHPNLMVDDKTINYWKGFGIPTYLFAIVIKQNKSEYECYYKRFTPILTKNKNQKDEPFYKVYENNIFLAYKENYRWGFCRDLFIDHVRCIYSRGATSIINPTSLGLQQYPNENFYFNDLLEEYSMEIRDTYNMLHKILYTDVNNHSAKKYASNADLASQEY